MTAVATRPRAADRAVEVIQRVETAATSPAGHGGTPRGLVLGHDPEFAQYVADLLANCAEVRMTTSPQIALGLLGSRAYGVVVIEHAAASALSLTTLVRHVRAGHPGAAIVVTAQIPLLNRQVVECFGADADDYLAAPFHPGEFDARVQRLLRRTAAQSERAPWPAAHGRGPRREPVAPDATHPRHGR